MGDSAMQVARLFSSFTVLSTGIGLIYVTLIVAENKADNAINYQRTRRDTASFCCIPSIELL